MGTLTSGQVAKEAGVHVETLRYYERTGLLAPPPRSAVGYRQYPPQTVARLGFIRQAQQLGFTLAEIAELLALHDDFMPCADVKARAVAKIAAVDERLAALTAVRDALLALVVRCDETCEAEVGCAVFGPNVPAPAAERASLCDDGAPGMCARERAH